MRAFAALALAGSVTVLMGVLPALAADQTVEARDSFFSPGTVALMPGDTLTVRHAGNLPHAFEFDDEGRQRQLGGTGWTETRTFTAGEARAQPYTFRCDLHPGMTGEVYVNATGTVPTPSATASPTATATGTGTATATPTATPTSTAGGGGAGPGQPPPPPSGGTADPRLRSVRMAARTFCVRRGRRCARPGVRMRIDLSAPARVRGTLARRSRRATPFRRFGTLDLGRVAAGPRTLSFTRTRAGRRLARGAYRLRLTAAGTTRTLTFTVR